MTATLVNSFDIEQTLSIGSQTINITPSSNAQPYTLRVIMDIYGVPESDEAQSTALPLSWSTDRARCGRAHPSLTCRRHLPAGSVPVCVTSRG